MYVSGTCYVFSEKCSVKFNVRLCLNQSLLFYVFIIFSLLFVCFICIFKYVPFLQKCRMIFVVSLLIYPRFVLGVYR